MPEPERGFTNRHRRIESKRNARSSLTLDARAADSDGVSECGFHYIADDLRAGWVQEWAASGIAEIEEYLAHRSLLDFLESDEL